MKTFLCALVLIFTVATIDAAPLKHRTSVGSYFWLASVQCSMPSAAALASSVASSTSVPSIVPTRQTPTRYVVFYRVFADMVVYLPQPIWYSVYGPSEASQAVADYISQPASNKGVLTAATGESIGWFDNPDVSLVCP